MEIVFLWLVLSIVAGIVASSKGRSGLGYFALSILLSPLVGLILAIALPAITAPPPEAPVKKSHERRRKCPYCAEMIKEEAKVCRFCGRDVNPTHHTGAVNLTGNLWDDNSAKSGHSSHQKAQEVQPVEPDGRINSTDRAQDDHRSKPDHPWHQTTQEYANEHKIQIDLVKSKIMQGELQGYLKVGQWYIVDPGKKPHKK